MTADVDRPSWHALPAEQVLQQLDVDSAGLSVAEAARRLKLHGPNRLRVEPPVPAWKILVAQLKSLVVALLLVAAIVSTALGDFVEGAAIGAVLAINTLLGFWTEWRARRAMQSLRMLQVQEAVVRRGGALATIDAATLVPGDVIVLEAGSAVPADARLLEASEISAIEAPLTGESVPAAKATSPVGADRPEELPIADRSSMLYKGTLVATGSGEAVVTATGAGTEIGRISELLRDADDEPTPLERRLDRLGRRLVGFVLALAVGVVALGAWRGLGLWSMVETGIALAVAAVPEGLPVVATIVLAVGMRRMLARHVLLRHLPSVETLGSTTVICTDKTGTLTAGEMTATTLHIAGVEIEISGAGYASEGELRIGGRRVDGGEVPGLDQALQVAVLANHARVEGEPGKQRVEGDPTEVALLVLGRKAGLDRDDLALELPVIGEVPFSSERMLMATFHRATDGGRIALVKGAPGKLVDLASRQLGEERAAPLDAEAREELLRVNRELASRGLRVLALAVRDLDEEDALDEGALRDLAFVGFVGLMDPPAPRVRETVDQLREAGIRTVMITGDQVITAEAIGRQLGVMQPGDETLDGRRMFELSDEALATAVGNVSVFARVSPEDKLRIVRAFQSRGEIVGMLGDGVNDAPALKQADIGVAMGIRGTDVAKETAEMVLADDRFESVAAAVEEGRVVFENIRKFVFYLFSCNLSEALVVAVGVVAGLPVPLLPLQILWLNLVTDIFPALALAMEPAEPELMRRPPRDPQAAILSRGFVRRILGYGGLITVATLGAFLWAIRAGDSDPRHPMTIAFMTLALAQLFHVFNARSNRETAFGGRLGRNPWIWGALALTLGLQLAAVYLTPLGSILGTIPLTVDDWIVVGVASLLTLAVGQAARALRWTTES